jgi:arylsulfatase A-like enzyme
MQIVTPETLTPRVADRAPAGWSLAGALWLAAAAGLAAGVAEVAALVVLKLTSGRYLFVARQVVWWTPAVLALLALLTGLMVWGVGRLWARIRLPGVYAGLVTGAAFVSPLLVFHPRLHGGAVLLLAAGIGVQTGRVLGPRLGRAIRPGRRAALALAGAVALLAVGAGVAERRLRLAGAEAGAPRADLPNVLLIVLDTVRAADLGLHGFELPTTPFLEELAARGVAFETAVSPSSWTLPSHASMFTGRWPSELRANWHDPLRSSRLSIAEVLRAAGYRTGGFVGNVTYTSFETGLGQGFETYEDRRLKLGELVHAVALGRYTIEAERTRNLLGERWLLDRNTAAELRARFVGWVDEGPRDRPFFGFLNLYDAHLPYDPADRHRGMFGSDTRPSRGTRLHRFLQGMGPLRPRDSTWLREARLRYDEAIATMDAEIRGLLDDLAARGLLENTVVIVTSDHGELFGEMGLIGHGNSLHINTIRVPLVMAGPGRPAGVRVDRPVSLRDLAATIADLANVPAPGLAGHSLVPLWEGDSLAPASPALSMISRVPDPRRRVPVARGSLASLITDSVQVVASTDGSHEVNRLQPHAPWARPIAGALRADHRAARLIDQLWTLWRGRSSQAPPLRTGTLVVGSIAPEPSPPPARVVAAGQPLPRRQSR